MHAHKLRPHFRRQNVRTQFPICEVLSELLAWLFFLVGRSMRRSQEVPLSGECDHLLDPADPLLITAMRSKQSERLNELRTVLIASGLGSIDRQATALGLSRSTAWFILHGTHKWSGLHPALLVRILSSERLPPSARAVILTYIQERCRGDYGHSAALREKFIERLECLGLELGSGSKTATHEQARSSR